MSEDISRLSDQIDHLATVIIDLKTTIAETKPVLQNHKERIDENSADIRDLRKFVSEDLGQLEKDINNIGKKVDKHGLIFAAACGVIVLFGPSINAWFTK